MWKYLVVTALFLCIVPATLSATSLNIPSGLNPGDAYRIVFVTSTTRDALSSNINDYNAFVNSSANSEGSLLQSLGATWSVIGSTSSISAITNIGGSSDVPIYLMDGTLLASGTGDLFDGSIAQAILYFENSETFRQANVWTGTQEDGTAYGTEFPPGSHYLGSNDPGIGVARSGFTDYQWIGYTRYDPNQALPFYGISNTLYVSSVPEPETYATLILGLGLLWFLARRGRGIGSCKSIYK